MPWPKICETCYQAKLDLSDMGYEIKWLVGCSDKNRGIGFPSYILLLDLELQCHEASPLAKFHTLNQIILENKACYSVRPILTITHFGKKIQFLAYFYKDNNFFKKRSNKS